MKVIDQLVTEFFLLRQHNPKASPINLISALQLGGSSDCIKLKISSVLRDISNSLIRGTIDEETLDLLEILEKLLRQQHSLITESHKSAYCWTAAECTLRFMWAPVASVGFFTEALERIWTMRIGVLKESVSDLVSHDLLNWETDLKKALEDPEIYQRIRETNIRYTAISFLNELLKEQWALLGSSSLESVIQRRLVKRKATEVEVEIADKIGDSNVIDKSTRRLESEAIYNASEGLGTSEGEIGNGNNSEKANDVEGVGCLENDGMDKANAENEEQKIGEEEHEPSLDKGDETAARELKDYLLEIQGHIDPSTIQGREPNNAISDSVDVTPRPTQMNRSGTSGQENNESPDNVNNNGSDSQGTWSGRARPRLSTPVPLNVSPLNKGKLVKSPVRRPKKLWTPEEVEALRAGIKEYGKCWVDIKNANPAIFAERTVVDLKDKWRNLVGRY